MPAPGIVPIIGAQIGKDKLLSKEVVVVVFRTGPKRYAYINPGFDISKGDMVLVPTRSGNDLEAQVVTMSSARRWRNLAKRTVISKL